VLGEGGGEDHRRRALLVGEVARDLQAVHAGHADVEQDEVRLLVADHGQRLGAVAGLARNLVAREFREQAAQAFARERLVVDDDHPHPEPSAPSRRT
jgi:hypothetical protein